MPWCPKCKNEYREGIKICADCGCELVEEEQLTEFISLTFGEEDQMKALKKHLEFNELQQVTLRYDEEDSVYELLVRKEDGQKAAVITKLFLIQQAERAAEEEAGREEDTAFGSTRKTGSSMYWNSSERAEENRSSGWILLIAGAAGLAVMLLGIMGVLPLRAGNSYMFYGVMSAVFVLFIVMGVISMKNARVFTKKAESENSLKNTLLAWCRENLDAENIDAQIRDMDQEVNIPNAAGSGNVSEESGDTDEMLYFKRFEKIKNLLNHQFVNLDQDFLDHFIDDTVYEMVFEDGKEAL